MILGAHPTKSPARLTVTMQLETSPDNSTWTAVPNTAMLQFQRPASDACLQGANPIGTRPTDYLQVLTYAPTGD